MLSDISKIEPLFKHFNPYNHTHLRVSIFLDLWLEITDFIPCKCHMDMTHVPQIPSPLPLLIRARRALYIPTQSGGSPESCFAPPGIDSPPTPPSLPGGCSACKGIVFLYTIQHRSGRRSFLFCKESNSLYNQCMQMYIPLGQLACRISRDVCIGTAQRANAIKF